MPCRGSCWPLTECGEGRPLVAWSIPLALGDSHRGFPVPGTTPEYFRHLRYGQQHPLGFSSGQPFAGLFEAVIGAELAVRLGYQPGDMITLRHGSAHLDKIENDHEHGAEHVDKPFRVVGILGPAGTPVDRTVHVSLASLETIHLNWQGGVPLPGLDIPPALAAKFDLTPKTLDAVLIELHQRTDVFRAQRQVADFTGEPLMATLPGLAMDGLWQLVALMEGAGCLFAPWANAHLGLDLSTNAFSAEEFRLIAGILATGLLASQLPGWRASRMSLADGLVPRL